jgi:hypothetical protein
MTRFDSRYGCLPSRRHVQTTAGYIRDAGFLAAAGTGHVLQAASDMQVDGKGIL